MESLDWRIALLVVFAALMHATWNALVKFGADRMLTVATVSAMGTSISLMLLPFLTPPARESWIFLPFGVLTHGGFKLFLLLAYGKGELSRVYPMARGLAPLLVALFSGIAMGEVLGTQNWVGVALISCGLAVLAFEKGLPAPGERGSLAFAVLTGAFIAAYTLIDGLGIRRSGSPFGYIAWLLFLDGIPMVTLTLILRRKHVAAFFSGGSLLLAICAGVLSLGAYVIVLWAISLGAVAPIAALRETGVIFAAIIGTVVMREAFGPRRILAALLVVIGVAALSF